MHTFSESGSGVPAFLAKLWRLVDDPETNNLICWSKDGRSFIIQNQAQFAHDLLPLNYKHNNMASFIRQLNMYGFHKITSIENGGLKFDRDDMEFSHPCFKRDCPFLLEHIKRKIATTKVTLDDKASVKPEAVSKVLLDVKAMRGRQDSLDSRFSVMKQENEALWREIASLRQKHAKQQQIVNKLIQFLITIVQPSRNMTSVKRHMQLMINDNPENAKLRNASESESECGPVIHELGEELLDEVADTDVDLMYNVQDSPYSNITPTPTQQNNESPLHVNNERPRSTSSLLSHNFDYSNQSAEDLLNNVAAAAAAIDTDVDFPTGVPSVLSRNGSSPEPAVIQSINPDGSKIVYHVTEVPDTPHPVDDVACMPPNYNDDNVLTTPMVRKEMARTQLLKQKNKQRRQNSCASVLQGGSSRPKTARVQRNNQVQQLLEQQQQQQLEKQLEEQLEQQIEEQLEQQHQQQEQKDRDQQQMLEQQQQQLPTVSFSNTSNATAKRHQPIQVKSELDPLYFLNDYSNDRTLTPIPTKISPNFNEDDQSTVNNGAVVAIGNSSTSMPITNGNTLLNTVNNTNPELYNPSSFIDGDMPVDIFEDSSIISNDSSSFDNYKLNQQQQYGRTTATNGKFSSYIPGGGGGSGAGAGSSGIINGASTSAAAKLNRLSAGGLMVSTTAATQDNKQSNGNLAVVARDEVNGHLENVQDELDTLRDLLRGDNYSLDANTLMGQCGGRATMLNNNRIYLSQAPDGDFFNKLFNDSEFLGSYGLGLPPTDISSNDKKGSELMTYQPVYDLSDIMNIDAENDLDAANANVDELISNSNARQLLSQSSMLNTPHHE